MRTGTNTGSGTKLRRLLLVGLGVASASMFVVPTKAAFANTLVVTNCNPSGSGSFAAAVGSATSGATISFALSPACSTIDLTATLDITTDLTISGPGDAALSIDGDGTQSVLAVGSAMVVVSGVTIADGGGASGGGIDNSGTLTLENATVSGNSADLGGGIFNEPSASLTVQDSTVEDNAATGDGGGIQNDGTAQIQSSTVAENMADNDGGGIASESATLTVTNSTIFGDVAGADGGGVYVTDPYNPSQPLAVTVENATIAGNTASLGGGIADDQGPVEIGATLLATSTSGGDCFFEIVPVTDLGYNLADDSSCGLTGTGDQSSVGAGLDPAGLQGNGGPTDTVALAAGSPAIDAVSDASLCPAVDQRGVARATPCDIGAYDTDLATVTGPCPTGTTSCSASVSTESETVIVTGNKLSDTSATITVSVGTQVLPCQGFSYQGQVTTLTDAGLKVGTSVKVTDTVSGLPSKKGILVCYQPVGASPPPPVLLPKCHGKGPVPCVKSIKEVGGNVVVVLLLPAGDPRFHIGGGVPEITSISPASGKPGKKLTISGLDLSEVTSVTVDGVRARITKATTTKVTAIVPTGAATGHVAVSSLAGTVQSPTVFTVT